ncbi:MAG: nuclear transport factor 2 family protein [Pseudomonadota bacterium]
MTDTTVTGDEAAATECVRQALAIYTTAWAAGDFTALRACYHERFTLHYFGSNSLAGVHTGKAASLAVLAEVTRRTNRKLLGIDAVMAGPQRGAVLVRETFSRDGKTAELQRLLVYTILEDKLHECWVYDQDQTLIDQFLREVSS